MNRMTSLSDSIMKKDKEAKIRNRKWEIEELLLDQNKNNGRALEGVNKKLTCCYK